ncbi:MAG: M23 family metallopeptidase [Planctomycetota bacterium]|jgi:hypothetical protein
MRFAHRIVLLVVLILSLSLALPAGQRQGGMGGKAGDEEGEFYGGKWPADVPKPAKVDHYLPFPAGKKYGIMPSPHGASSNRYAIDFCLPIGAPVCASADGWVLKAIERYPTSGGGTNSLILKHADGNVTCYLHLANKGVIPKLGEFVFRGDVVATSGASGGGPAHLHYSQNREQMLECLQPVFVEGPSNSVSQNKTFEQQYEKELKKFDEIEVGVVWAAKFRLWSKALGAKKKVDGLKPKDSDHPRFKMKYKNMLESANALDAMIAGFVKSAQDAMNEKDYPTALEVVTIGLVELKGTDHEKTFSAIKAELEKLPDYEDLAKALKKLAKARKRLNRAYEKDAKGGRASKRVKDYKSYLKSYKSSNDSPAVRERIDALTAQAQKEAKK